ncbi:spore germination protein [Paenibacillus sp. FJAT-27812]|uniref:spore germination protein n=1 Tax=Paenibacillus sp. FJAT-27812 TaxID=1684143 RepID=UPI0006A7DA3D|nr:spore germination protein [Paenibacillus sp. FJAT-27812]
MTSQPATQLEYDRPAEQLTPSIRENETLFRDVFHNCSDILFRPIQIEEQLKLMIIYVDGLIDTVTLESIVQKPHLFQDKLQGNLAEQIKKEAAAIASTQSSASTDDVIKAVLKGNAAILIDGEANALIVEIPSYEKRAIQEPTSEVTLRGPREGFIETLRVNTSLVRRKIQSPRLKFESMVIGELSQTIVSIAYIEGIAEETVIDEVRKRLGQIKIDAILGSGYLEEFIEDSPYSPFPQVQNTERPDVTAAALLEGKVAIMEDGSPYTLIVPMTFWVSLQSADDYYERFFYSSAIRWIRYVLLIISLLLPSVYVAIISYHPQLMPTNLLLSIAVAREPSPFPAVIEAFIMEFTFEALREAGVRLPRAAGSAVSIVGALVIGQAAVQAGIVSAPMVIVVAATGIASFTIPRYNFGTSFRLLRFPLLILSGMMGFFGIAFGILFILIHLVNLNSYGVPYFSPIAPRYNSDLKDVLFRAPRWTMHKRPAFTGVNKERLSSSPMPNKKTNQDED